jgi:3,4-dihydroxy-9,10-secoandrosta-1,3,5(10)-triene-9,17-dione 4,5-dioxygenase
MDVRALGYIALGAVDVPAWRTFGTQVLGMMADTTESGELRLRADDRPYRLTIKSAETEQVVAVGWEVAARADLDVAAAELEAAGVTVEREPDVAADRRVAELISFDAPDGMHHELFWKAEVDHLPFVSPVGVTGFVMGGLGLGHVVLAADDVDAAARFYTEVMGFRLSDTMTLGRTRVIFLHCNQRHHSLALGSGRGPALAHFMLEVASIDDVGYGLDRATDHGVRIRESLGRHTNDEMFSFYAATPSGFSVEYGWGGRTVDDRTWVPTETTRGSYWGHRRPPKPAPAAG